MCFWHYCKRRRTALFWLAWSRNKILAQIITSVIHKAHFQLHVLFIIKSITDNVLHVQVSVDRYHIAIIKILRSRLEVDLYQVYPLWRVLLVCFICNFRLFSQPLFSSSCSLFDFEPVALVPPSLAITCMSMQVFQMDLLSQNTENDWVNRPWSTIACLEKFP